MNSKDVFIILFICGLAVAELVFLRLQVLAKVKAGALTQAAADKRFLWIGLAVIITACGTVKLLNLI